MSRELEKLPISNQLTERSQRRQESIDVDLGQIETRLHSNHRRLAQRHANADAVTRQQIAHEQVRAQTRICRGLEEQRDLDELAGEIEVESDEKPLSANLGYKRPDGRLNRRDASSHSR